MCDIPSASNLEVHKVHRYFRQIYFWTNAWTHSSSPFRWTFLLHSKHAKGLNSFLCCLYWHSQVTYITAAYTQAYKQLKTAVSTPLGTAITVQSVYINNSWHVLSL